jgi:hypothetical protein
MKAIRLNLGNAWYYFASQKFHPVGNKRNFLPGDLLYRDSEFYRVVPKQKLKKISWTQGGKYLYQVLGGEGSRPNYQISKRKILFAFKPNAEEEVQTCVKPTSFSLKQRAIPEDEVAEIKKPADTSKSRLEAQKRAKTLLYNFVRTNNNMVLYEDFLYLRSTNRKFYSISLDTGAVYNITDKGGRCVRVKGIDLPMYDIVLAKALVIAYRPNCIRHGHFA